MTSGTDEDHGAFTQSIIASGVVDACRAALAAVKLEPERRLLARRLAALSD